MSLHKTLLPAVPSSFKHNEVFQSVSFKFTDCHETSEMALLSPRPDLTSSLFELWSPYRTAGTDYLKGNFGYLSITVPWKSLDSLPIRLHIATRYITFEDRENYKGIEFAKDFDRLMDVAQSIISDMIDASFIELGKRSVQIISEPINHEFQLKKDKIIEMSENIGCSWLYKDTLSIFHRYSVWDAINQSWLNEA